MLRYILIVVTSLWPLIVAPAVAGEVTLGVASNFLSTAETIATRFEEETGNEVVVSHGSTGQLYAQIVSGAPFDIFLAADRKRPALVKEAGLADETATYATGRLVLVSRNEIDLEDASPAFEGRRVALADPIVAPYGLAATAAMERLSLDTATFQPLLVANVAQAATLFATENAEIAFVAGSLVPLLDPPFAQDLTGRHPPIKQDGALLSRASDNPVAKEFWDFLLSPEIAALIVAEGYAPAE